MIERHLLIVPMAIRLPLGAENHDEVDAAVSDYAIVYRHAVRRRDVGNQRNPGRRLGRSARRVARRPLNSIAGTNHQILN
jgi:hypothetical protein